MELATTVVALAVVCALAIGALRALGRKGVGGGAAGLKVVARLALEPRRTLYVVEAGGKCLLVGVGDGPMAVLAELDPSQVRAATPEPAATSLGDVVKRVLGVRA
jgi:flagellar protein FliO/FliZ